MALLTPFRGLRPPPALLPALAELPYDVVSRAEATTKAQARPQSFFRVTRPEVDLPPTVDEHAAEVHARGAENLARFVREGWLRQDAVPTLYLYRQRHGAHARTGVVAAVDVQAYEQGDIRRHELTRKEKEDDRTAHLEALGAHTEPVLLTYRGQRALDALVARLAEAAPEAEFVSAEGLSHSFWVLGATEARMLAEAFRAVPTLYIADGHHRSAAAARVWRRHQGRPELREGHARFLAVLVPDAQLQVQGYHRMVKDLGGHSPESLLARVKERFDLQASTGAGVPDRRHTFELFIKGRWIRLVARPGSYPETALGALDVSILQENVLGPVLGIRDPRTDARLGALGGVAGPTALEAKVQSGEYAAAFALFPTSVAEMMATADAGQVMPPKSTWFEPKLYSGLVVQPF